MTRATSTVRGTLPRCRARSTRRVSSSSTSVTTTATAASPRCWASTTRTSGRARSWLITPACEIGSLAYTYVGTGVVMVVLPWSHRVR